MLNKLWSIAVIIAALATASILLLQPQLNQVALLPDEGAAWYFWKRPDPNFASQVSAWGGYITHQLFIWGVIVWAKKNREALKDRTRLHSINSVSYTHLRAHETEADLVCRLLLEKKKK